MEDRPLPSWNDGAARAAILDFVARASTEGGPDYVWPAERIAVFDNDGALWCEQPMQAQVFCPAPARASPCSSTTTTPGASSPTTGSSG